ncbi:MAG: hypothetical protein WCK39_08415 [Methanomassiliicoccales archaeon]
MLMVISVILMAGTASASTSSATTSTASDGSVHFNGQVNISAGVPFVFPFSYSGTEIRFDYFVGVTNNVTVNILVMGAADYLDYLANGTAHYVDAATRMNTMVDLYFGNLPEGAYVMVVEVADSTGPSSEFICGINAGPFNGGLIILIVVVIAVVVLIVIVLALFLLGERGAKGGPPAPVFQPSAPSSYCGRCGSLLPPGTDTCSKCGHKNN